MTWHGGAESGSSGGPAAAGAGGGSDRFGGLRQLDGEPLGEVDDFTEVAEIAYGRVDGLADAGVDAFGADLLGDAHGFHGQDGALLRLAAQQVDGGHTDQVQRVGTLVLLVLGEQLHGPAHQGVGEGGVGGAAAGD